MEVAAFHFWGGGSSYSKLLSYPRSLQRSLLKGQYEGSLRVKNPSKYHLNFIRKLGMQNPNLFSFVVILNLTSLIIFTLMVFLVLCEN